MSAEPTTHQDEEALLCAKVLSRGTRVALALMVLSYLAYLLGLGTPRISPAQAAANWHLPHDAFAQATGMPQGWAFLDELHHADMLAMAGLCLVPLASRPGRVVAVEVMTNSPQVVKHIVDGDTIHLHRVIEESSAFYRMQTINQALGVLVKRGHVTLDAAQAASPEPDELLRILRTMGYELPR